MPKTQVSCPNCRQPVMADVEKLFDLHLDPSAKQRLLSGAFNIIQCQLCGYQGALATPIVYHDPEKELLLTFVPPELNLPRDEQERAIGGLINRVVDNLAQEKRKGYLFNPQATLTMQGLLERILEADGITREMLEAQQQRLRVFMGSKGEFQRLCDPLDKVFAVVYRHQGDKAAAVLKISGSFSGCFDRKAGLSGAAWSGESEHPGFLKNPRNLNQFSSAANKGSQVSWEIRQRPRDRGAFQFQQSQGLGPLHSLAPVFYIQFAEYVPNVILNGAFSQVQFLGNLAVRKPV